MQIPDNTQAYDFQLLVAEVISVASTQLTDLALYTFRQFYTTTMTTEDFSADICGATSKFIHKHTIELALSVCLEFVKAIRKMDFSQGRDPTGSHQPGATQTEEQTDENEKYHGHEDLESGSVNTVTNTRPNPQDAEKFQRRVAETSNNLSKKNAAEAYDDLSSDDFDFQRILKTFVQKEKDQGVKRRSVGVMFKDLTARGVDQAASFAPSIGEVIRSTLNFPGYIKSKMNLPLRNIIEDFNGLVCKGEMLLVLGRPGSGCSTLLKCCAGEIDQLKGISGEVTYDGVDQRTMKKRFKGDIIYNAELDIHFPVLTVNETMSFAIASRTPRSRIDNMSRKEFVNKTRDILLHLFGLTHASNTKVGNDYVRGVSGGERKRVSIAEVMAGRPSVVCWDNATRGLDSSTALEYTHAIRTSTNLLDCVALVAIYQAGENIYNLFDKVTVIYSGKQVFFGPISKAKKYFERMGYECPSRQTTPEFLTAVTDPNGRYVRKGMENVPSTPEEFVAYWKQSPDYAELISEMEDYSKDNLAEQTYAQFKDSAMQEKMKLMVHSSSMTISFRHQIALCFRRGIQRLKGDKAYAIINTGANIVQSLIMGSLFYNIPSNVNGAFSRGGVLFFALLFNALTSVAEITNTYAQRPIIQKQKSYAFYMPAAEALSSMVSDLPLKLVTAVCFNLILYFLANLNRTPGQFFLYLFFILIVTQVMKVFFQMIATLTKTVETANSVAGLGLLALSIYAGYVIPRPSMHPWFKWISYLNPVAFGFENLMANEFHNRRMDCADTLIPQGGPYDDLPIEYKVCAVSGSKPGLDYVLGDDYLEVSFQYKWRHLWRNFGIMIGFWMFFVFIYVCAAQFLRPTTGGGDVLLFKRTKESAKAMKKAAENKSSSSSNKNEGAIVQNEMSKMTENKNETAVSELQQSIKSKQIFSWQHVNYVIPVKDGTRKLLDDIQGYVKPGTMTALVGESGAGKTTLLNVLAQRIDFGVVTGDMLVNGKSLDASFQRRTGYVQQQDLHLAEATVREALRFAAELRQPKSVPRSEKYEYVETIIGLLGMEEYSEAIIGEVGRGLNVEQRKKLSIGVELAAKPSLLLFLDEPTSGLDSQSAWAIVSFLRRLADAGQSILCTIHQPSATLFEQFDRLLLLKRGGKTVYFGDIGKNSSTLLDYFQRQGAPPCKPSENPAEYVLNVIGAGATAGVNTDWNEKWTNSEDCALTTKEIADMQEEMSKLPDENSTPEMRAKFAMPWTSQFRAVTLRMFKYYWRSPVYIRSKLFLSVLAGLFIGFTFWNVSRNISGIQNGMFAIFMALLISVSFINQMQPRTINLRELFEVRESMSDTYHWSNLFLSQLVVEIPYNIFFMTLFFCCFYFPTKFSTDAPQAGYFYFIYVVLYQIFITTFGLSIAAFSPDASSASVISSLLFSMLLSFCGVLQPRDNMPGFWVFMYRVSPLTYFVQSALGAVFHNREVMCAAEEFNVFNPPPGYSCYTYAGQFAAAAGGYINNLNDTSHCQFCRFSVADEYLATIGIVYHSSHWRNVGIMCAYIVFNVFFIFAGYYIFRIMKWSLPRPLHCLRSIGRSIMRSFAAGAEPENMEELSADGKQIKRRKDERALIERQKQEDNFEEKSSDE
ncbi:ABC-2 type transporter-domain-containing protein [Dipodascopsis uninucleata]